MTLHTRRELLLSTAATATLTGCTASPSSGASNEIDLFSNSNDAHTVDIEILTGDSETLFSRSFRLAPEGTSNDIEPFGGDPAEIVVQIDDAEPLRSEWPEYPTELRANETPQTYPEKGCGRIDNKTVTGIFVVVIGRTHVELEPVCVTPE